jgi:nucleotide-binding universal stress UspA family protein
MSNESAALSPQAAFRHILFPVDFTDRCAAAAKHVRAMAASFDANVTLVHAVEDPLKWYGVPDSEAVVEVDIPRVREESGQSLRKFAQTEFPGSDIAIVSDLGDPADLIERISKSANADLIMMPTRGRGRFRAALLGSITTKVLYDLTIPVWTDTHREAAQSQENLPIRSVVCAIDLGPESASVLRFAAGFASRCGAKLCIAHGVPTTEMLLGKYSEIEPPMYMEDFARTEIEKLQAEAGTSAEVRLESAPIATAVGNAASGCSADLVIIGRGEVGHSAGRLKEHTHSIIRESSCPVLSL